LGITDSDSPKSTKFGPHIPHSIPFRFFEGANLTPRVAILGKSNMAAKLSQRHQLKQPVRNFID